MPATIRKMARITAAVTIVLITPSSGMSATTTPIPAIAGRISLEAMLNMLAAATAVAAEADD